MTSGIESPLKKQAKTPIIGDTFRLNPQFIQSRQSIDEADGGGTVVRLGVSKADIPRVGGNRVEIFREADEPPIELHQSLDLIVTGSYIENWTMGPATIIEAVAEIVQFTPKFYVRVDGISMPDCRALEKRFGPGFPALIEANPDILSKTCFSKEKQDIIFKACKREILARKNDTADTLNIIAILCACGVTKAKARKLAADYDPTKSPYQFFFKGRLTFLQADRVAKLIDPKRAAEDRVFLFVIDQFLRTQHIVVSQQDIRIAVWNNFGVDYLRVDDEIERLVDLGVVRKIERKGTSPAVIEAGARVATSAFGNGVILSVTKNPATGGQHAIVKFDNGEKHTMHPAYLRAETTLALFGLTRLIEAEETIARILSRNIPIKISDEDLSNIEQVLDHAAVLLNRPDFKPNKAQRQAVLQAFQYRFTIITGSPGTGKTAIVALICAAAALIYPGDASPIMGVALAGRAASVLRNAAIWWHDGVPVTMNASTIHRALRMESVEDDEFVAYGSINFRGLVSEESSMDSSSLMATTLTNTSARHIIFIGDQHQLQPIGSGSPFRDMIASNVIPTIYLTENYRTNCLGIQALCADILNGTISSTKLPRYEALGGVFYVSCAYSQRAFMIGEHYADLIARGFTPHDIAILSPHNIGEAGTKAINVAVREALGYPADKLIVDDILLVTSNDYEAPRPDAISEDDTEIIFNGELCKIIKVGDDFIDVEFEETCEGIRQVRLLTNNGLDANGCLPVGVAFGYAMSVHKGQGSQFKAVIVLAERGNKQFGIVQRSNIYTAVSRGVERVVVIGDFDDLVHAALTPDLPRNTLLRDLLIEGAKS